MKPIVQIKSIPLSELKEIIGLVAYEKGRVVRRELSRNEALTIHVYAVEKGLTISPRINPGDALLQLLEGKALVTIAGNGKTADAGRSIPLPAGVPCEITAVERLKALLTVIRQPDLIEIDKSDE